MFGRRNGFEYGVDHPQQAGVVGAHAEGFSARRDMGRGDYANVIEIALRYEVRGGQGIADEYVGLPIGHRGQRLLG
ncbi:Uncharacterised protein [Bordetella pertussis]|nr:Uncharacterised protein [Bordetella pertussis]